MQILIAQMDVKRTPRTNRLSVFIYQEPGADFEFPVYVGPDAKHAPRKDAFVRMEDALRFATSLVTAQLER